MNGDDREPTRERIVLANVRTIRSGYGANCSSIGSVVDTLFGAAVVGGAVMAAVAAALAREDVRVVGERSGTSEPSPSQSPTSNSTDPGDGARSR